MAAMITGRWAGDALAPNPAHPKIDAKERLQDRPHQPVNDSICTRFPSPSVQRLVNSLHIGVPVPGLPVTVAGLGHCHRPDPHAQRRRLRRDRGGRVGAAATARQARVRQPLRRRRAAGKAIIRGEGWYPLGFALHMHNGALFGAAYANVAPSLPIAPRSPPRASRGAHRALDHLAPRRTVSPLPSGPPAAAGDGAQSPGVRSGDVARRLVRASARRARAPRLDTQPEPPSPNPKPPTRAMGTGPSSTRFRSSRRLRATSGLAASGYVPRRRHHATLSKPPARLAQSVEHFICNEGVRGSSPGRVSRPYFRCLLAYLCGSCERGWNEAQRPFRVHQVFRRSRSCSHVRRWPSLAAKCTGG